MKFTKATNMGLHVMTYLVQHDEQQNLSIHELAERFTVSATYLSKILTQLAKANLVISVPGVKGGYRLKKAASELSFGDVIEALEGTPDSFSCIAITTNPCPIQETLDQAQEKMITDLKTKKLIDLNGI